MDIISICTIDTWTDRLSPLETNATLAKLESGNIIFCPQLKFNLQEEEERSFFEPHHLKRKTKNISFNVCSKQLKGLHSKFQQQSRLKSSLARFARDASTLMSKLFPHYAIELANGQTSYYPVQIKNQTLSPLKDDSRLHIDAFPTNPIQGKRIFRLFCNINPFGQPRVWRIGEQFIDLAQRFLPKIAKPIPGSAKALYWAGITKGIRTDYDHIMLAINHQMKLDNDYQNQVKSKELAFPAGTSWIVATDALSHAVISGQYILEQTFLLPTTAMQDQTQAPLRILENLMGRTLI